MPLMSSRTSSIAHLSLLPGSLMTMFFVELDQAATVFAVRTAQFLDGLMAACALMNFSELQREEPSLEDLLPWSGNV